MIVGQEKICNMVRNSTLDTFPRTLMLVGEEGSGKHLICDYICSHLNLICVDITEKLSLETIDDIYQKVEPFVYTIKINEVSVKEENLILKFLEEPLKNSFIILIADTEIGVLPTILNRCRIWHLQHYKKDTLKSFMTTDDMRILDIARTPGMVLKLCSYPFGDMIDLANKILDNIHRAAVPNTLTLSKYIAFKDEKDKYDVDIFMSIMLSAISKRWAEVNDDRLVSAYTTTSDLCRSLRITGVDKKALFDRYLIDLSYVMRRESL
jgi:hypothetical protein